MRNLLSILAFSIFSFSSFAAETTVPELKIEEIKPGVYLHKSYSQVNGFGLVSSNGLVVVEANKAFIVDTPWSGADTAKLVQWLSEKELEIIGSISTHSHEDRTAGIKWLNEQSIPTFASVQTNKILQSQGKPLASHSFAQQISLMDGQVEAYYPGGGHSKDNIVVWLPQARILFGGCMVRSKASTSLGYTGEAMITEWASSVEKVLERYSNADFVVPGHGKIGSIDLLTYTISLTDKILSK